MRRSALPSRAAFATCVVTTALVATAVPSIAQPVTPHRAAAGHDGAKRTTVNVHDARGDVIARTSTNLPDVDDSGDDFKPGAGTVVAPTAADKAMDLTKVTYRVVRVGTKPSLKVTYQVAGPFAYAHHESTTDTSDAESVDVDVLQTTVGRRYVLQLVSDQKRSDNGLFVNNSQNDKVVCHGMRSKMRLGAHTATQTVPLSCLTDLDINASKLRAVAHHYLIDVKFSIVGTGEDQTYQETGSFSVATDTTSPTRRLPFTR